MTFDTEQAQRRDIETALGRVSLGLDTENVSANPYIYVPSSFVGNAWFQQGEKIVKLNLTEDDSLSFVVSALDSLEYKNVTNVIVGFDYEVTNVKVNYPTLVNISFASSDLTSYKSCETILTTQGHIEVDCSLFDFSYDIINNAIIEQGFCIGLNFNGNKSNATVKISNVTFGFKYSNLLQEESNAVANRISMNFDAFVEDEDLVIDFLGTSGTGGHQDSGGGIDYDTAKQLVKSAIYRMDIDLGADLMSNGYLKIDVSLNREDV